MVQVETLSWNICATALQNKFQQALHSVTLRVETCSRTLKLVSKFVVPVSDWCSVTRPREITPSGVVYSETPDFITSAMVATVAEIGSGSTLLVTCLAMGVQKSFTKPTMLHSAMPVETWMAAPFYIKFYLKFEHAASSMKSPCCAACKRTCVKPGFHKFISVISVVRLGWPYGNTHTIIQNDPHYSSGMVVPIALRSISTTETTPMISYTTDGKCQRRLIRQSRLYGNQA